MINKQWEKIVVHQSQFDVYKRPNYLKGENRKNYFEKQLDQSFYSFIIHKK